jgi:hypothetical protein
MFYARINSHAFFNFHGNGFWQTSKRCVKKNLLESSSSSNKRTMRLTITHTTLFTLLISLWAGGLLQDIFHHYSIECTKLVQNLFKFNSRLNWLSLTLKKYTSFNLHVDNCDMWINFLCKMISSIVNHSNFSFVRLFNQTQIFSIQISKPIYS